MPCYSKVLPFHFHSLIQAFKSLKPWLLKRQWKNI